MAALRDALTLLVVALFMVGLAEAAGPRPASSFKGFRPPVASRKTRNVDNQPFPPPLTKRNLDLLDSTMHKRVVGGEAVADDELPFVVALLFKKLQIKGSLDSNGQALPEDDWYARQFCGGALIAPQWVVTAAHCILSPSTGKATPANQLTIGLGVTDLRDGDEKGIEIDVERYVIHPEWKGPDSFYVDLAVIKLKTPVTYTDAIQKIDIIPESGFDMYSAGSTVISAGWGTISMDTALSPVMRQVEIPVVDLQTCNAIADPTWLVSDDYICAGSPGHDTCRGDSGGPLYVRNSDNIRNGDGGRPEYWLIGVVDGGNTDHICDGKYGTYTDVGKFHHWVQNQITGRK